jgi:hypothetical protein
MLQMDADEMKRQKGGGAMKRRLPLVLVLGCGLLLSIECIPWTASHDDAFSTVDLFTASAADLKTTVVSPHLEAPIAPGRSVLWCGTFQLVWNEMCGLVGEDLHFENDPPMVAEMNKKAFTAASLDDDSYVALAGHVRDGIHGKITAALATKFKGRASPHFLPNPATTPRPQDIAGYAYLFKHLEFAVPFERLEQPLPFEGTPVSAFGMGEYKPGHQAMYPQISILEYKGPDDFIIELKTKTAGDQLILAKVRPAATLGQTVAEVNQRIAAAKPTPAVMNDVLAVPRFNFDVTRQFQEIMGAGYLVVKNPAVAKDLRVMEALQNIRFELDEKGVRLRSEAHMSLSCGAESRAVTHWLIFDKPFLVLMKRTGAAVPYFAMWVGGPELLIPYKAAA